VVKAYSQARIHSVDTSGPRPCSAAATLDIVGERWSLLIVRELSYGNRRFEGVQRATGAPRNMLSVRLKTLEHVGVLKRHLYMQHPPRYEYHLTTAGKELVPVLLALQTWGDKNLGARPTMPLQHHSAQGSHRLRPKLFCTTCAKPIDHPELSLGIPDPWALPTSEHEFGPT
jgi:DNA-binding HxlR family transcriptional regulator